MNGQGMYLVDSLTKMSGAELEGRHQEVIASLKAAPSHEAAETAYRRDVLPVEAERIRRAAVNSGESPLDLLFVTVGAQGDSPALAVIASPAKYIVLLHTEEAKRSADYVVDQLGLKASEAVLESVGTGKDVGELYKKMFDRWRERNRPESVGVDLTGGLKTMSAAAAVAGFSLPKARVFYVDAEQPKVHGRQYWIRERRIEMQNPLTVFGEIRRAVARDLLASRRYPAAATAYEELARTTDAGPDRFRAKLAKGYDALDRLDFETAEQELGTLAETLERRNQDRPDLRHDPVLAARAKIRANAEAAGRLKEMCGTIRPAEDPAANPGAMKSDAYRDFVAMLIAGAERRYDERLFDIAALLAYRALEAVPQRRLALRGGVDPGQMDWSRLSEVTGKSIESILAACNSVSKKDHEMKREPRVARAAVYTLLAVTFPDDVADVKGIERFAGVGEARNRSVLAHGISKLDERTVSGLIGEARKLFDRMLQVENVDPEARRMLLERHRFTEIRENRVKEDI